MPIIFDDPAHSNCVKADDVAIRIHWFFELARSAIFFRKESSPIVVVWKNRCDAASSIWSAKSSKNFTRETEYYFHDLVIRSFKDTNYVSFCQKSRQATRLLRLSELFAKCRNFDFCLQSHHLSTRSRKKRNHKDCLRSERHEQWVYVSWNRVDISHLVHRHSLRSKVI